MIHASHLNFHITLAQERRLIMKFYNVEPVNFPYHEDKAKKIVIWKISFNNSEKVWLDLHRVSKFWFNNTGFFFLMNTANQFEND